VRGSGALALPPFPHRGCADCARNLCRGHHEQEPFPVALSDFFCTCAKRSRHIPQEQGQPATIVTRSHISEGKRTCQEGWNVALFLLGDANGGSEDGFGEVAIDLREARFWIVSGLPTIRELLLDTDALG
jgi:hypothetical protein